MPLPLPKLDDRDFDQLVDEAREMLPAASPGWTDHNLSDPGITLLELFAYLAEMGLYRLDRVSPASRRTFLRLLGVPVDPARVAQTVLLFERTNGTGVVQLPPGVQVASANDRVVFQTTASLSVVEARVVALFGEHEGQLTDLTTSNSSMSRTFRPFGDRPAANDALYIGFDRAPGPAGTLMRLYVFGESTEGDAATWRALAVEALTARRAARVCGPHVPRRVGHFWRHYDARFVWEYFDTAGEWRSLAHVRDCTRALTISGPVAMRAPGPARHAPGGVAGGAGAFFIRARLRAGEYDCPPTIQGVRMNAVKGRHAADVVGPEPIGVSFGRASEEYRLAAHPVAPGSSRVVVTTTDGDIETWTEVLDWDRSGPFDSHYRLDTGAGAVVFGNGRAGRVPPAGAAIEATYRVGGGPEGNVPAGTITRVRAHGPNVSLPDWSVIGVALGVSQPIAAHGGAPPMSLDAAEGRAVRQLAEARAAVTLADLERVAKSVPGVPVARAYAIPLVHPAAPCLRAPGCVTVVVVPACVDERRNPSAAFLRGVAAALDRRRPVAAEVHVVGARYTKVMVRARLHPSAEGSRVVTSDEAHAALDTFFHPLRGGPEGHGWPVGRSVYRSEVLALLAALPGVAHVSDVEISHCRNAAGRCGNVEICADGLVQSGPHRIEVR